MVKIIGMRNKRHLHENDLQKDAEAIKKAKRKRGLIVLLCVLSIAIFVILGRYQRSPSENNKIQTEMDKQLIELLTNYGFKNPVNIASESIKISIETPQCPEEDTLMFLHDKLLINEYRKDSEFLKELHEKEMELKQKINEYKMVAKATTMYNRRIHFSTVDKKKYTGFQCMDEDGKQYLTMIMEKTRNKSSIN